jgi:DNA polymerase III delta prime subunit
VNAMIFSKSSLWVEKYRPPTIEQCIMPKAIKTTLEQFIISGRIPNLMLYSTTPGSGKTTTVKALAEQLEFEILFINSSEQRGIDILRNDITQFVSTLSLEGRKKCVIFDEFDNSTSTTQSALRGFIEQYSDIHFFFTCNYIDKVLPALVSRCTAISFSWPKEEEKGLKVLFYKRVKEILTNENIKFNKQVLAQVINAFFPDFRRTINELQLYSISGNVDEGMLSFTKTMDLSDLLKQMKLKQFTEVRRWVEESNITNYDLFFAKFYTELKEVIDHTTLPPCIILLADRQYKSAFMHDALKQVNVIALLVEIMQEAKFK